MVMKSIVFCITPYGPLKFYRRFRRNIASIRLATCFQAGFLLGLFFNICSSETSVDFQWTTQRHIPEDSTYFSESGWSVPWIKVVSSRSGHFNPDGLRQNWRSPSCQESCPSVRCVWATSGYILLPSRIYLRLFLFQVSWDRPWRIQRWWLCMGPS
jgi:hypothetical protein